MIVCGIRVDGVALATVISQCISAGLILWCLLRIDGICHLDLKQTSAHLKDKLFQIIRVIAGCLQGAVFSISNVLIQSSINSFGSQVMAGNTACSNLEGFVYTAMNSIYQAALSFWARIWEPKSTAASPKS